ncbi:MAG: AI-2E family transporter [Parachlamydiaceae bacterium]|nr:AI-2E family transporter [Parachlamydiaceae bacterium]
MTSIQKPKRRVPPQKTTHWYNQKFFKYLVETIGVLTIILIFYKVAIILTPVVDFVSILATPVILSLLLYYLFRPIVYFLQRYKIPRVVSILMIYLALGCFIVLFFLYIGPDLGHQLGSFANNSVETLEEIKSTSKSIFFNYFNLNLDKEIETRMASWLQQGSAYLSRNIVDFVGIMTRIATILAVIPFIVFYLLKDDHDFTSNFVTHVPTHAADEARKIINNVDQTLSDYIRSLVIVSCSIGVLLFIGYWIIGLKYAMILSLIALVFTTIPFVGPFLAIAPAILVGFADSPFMILKVIIVFAIVQQTESNIISPQIIGQRLHIHPLTIILLLLAAGSLYGLIGLLLATPVYAVVRVLAINLYKIYQLRSNHWKKNLSEPAEK